MKQALLFFFLLLLGGYVARAQYATPVDGPLSYKFGGIYDANGHRLTRSEGNANYFLIPEQQRLFRRGQQQYYWGAGLIVGSVAMMSIGANVQDKMEGRVSGEASEAELFIWSAAIMTGIPLLITGNVLFFSGRHKLKDVVQDYNYNRQKDAVSLSLGSQRFGYGVALTF